MGVVLHLGLVGDPVRTDERLKCAQLEFYMVRDVMKLGRIAVDGTPRIGVFKDESVTPVSPEITSFGAALERITAGDSLPTDDVSLARSEIRYLPPTTNANNVFGVGLNYRSHVEETNNAVPERPLVFLKLFRSLVGHEDSIAYHTAVTSELDYEAELAAIIGTPARNVTVDQALEHVAGYTIINDTTARDVQHMKLGDSDVLDWFSAKAMSNTTPVGPYVVTSDEITDPQALHIESRLNGDVMQDEGTHLMIRSVAELIAFVSTRLELQPGDIIATGTPEGVGAFQDIRLDDGDTIDITIDGIGTLSNTVESID